MRVRGKLRTSLLQRAATQAGSGRHCRWAADGKQPPGKNQGCRGSADWALASLALLEGEWHIMTRPEALATRAAASRLGLRLRLPLDL